jgi:pimeloyl-ACP methyl ester carboxylesterase
MKHRIGFAITAALFLWMGASVGCDTAAQQPEVETASEDDTSISEQSDELGYEPVFEPGDCQFELSASFAWAAPECGYLVVPEDRSQPDGPTVRLHAAIFRSIGPNPAPDPVIYLMGGGAYNALDSAAFYMEAVGNEILMRRDFIMYNQRGAHYNEPSLECPGYEELMAALIERGASLEERDAETLDFMLACQENLLAQGINLNMYDTDANAADANDLRIALGYEQANYYGTSYGTRLGLEIMRDYPEGVRSVILDSVYPPQVDFYSSIAAGADRAFNTVLGDCAESPSSVFSYGDIDERLPRLVEQLNEDPVTLELENGQVAEVDGNVFLDALFLAMYPADAIPFIPYFVRSAEHRDLEPLSWAITQNMEVGGEIAWGARNSMECREDVAFDSYENALARAADVPEPIAAFFTMSYPYNLCESWQVTPADPSVNEPVVSNVPALVLAGRYDPVTPPEWSRLAAETLSSSFYYEFPNVGHGVMRSDRCALDIGLQFVEDPTTEPDTSCMELLGIPDFFAFVY